MFFGKVSARQAAECRWLAASLFGTLFAVSLAAPASASVLITIDKSTQQMSVAVDGAQRYFWPVSTGRPGYDTPSGLFKPNRMDADHYSQEWDNAPMPHAIFFNLEATCVLPTHRHPTRRRLTARRLTIRRVTGSDDALRKARRE